MPSATLYKPRWGIRSGDQGCPGLTPVCCQCAIEKALAALWHRAAPDLHHRSAHTPLAYQRLVIHRQGAVCKFSKPTAGTFTLHSGVLPHPRYRFALVAHWYKPTLGDTCTSIGKPRLNAIRAVPDAHSEPLCCSVIRAALSDLHLEALMLCRRFDLDHPMHVVQIHQLLAPVAAVRNSSLMVTL